MRQSERDEMIDREIERRRSGASGLPPELASETDRQYQADVLWLDEQIRRMPRPSCDLANRVATAMRQPSREPVRTNRFVRVAAGLSALAAGLVLVVLAWPPSVPQGPDHDSALVTNDAPAPQVVDGVDVARTVRQGTAAYVELVQTLASSVAIPGEGGPPATASEEVQLAGITPVGRAIQGSTRTIQTASEELRLSVEPITESALDAFGFLWKPIGPSQTDPST